MSVESVILRWSDSARNLSRVDVDVRVFITCGRACLVSDTPLR